MSLSKEEFVESHSCEVRINIKKELGDAMNIQYKKGVLELCVLSLLAKRDRYGYEISEFLSHKIDIADGTVYPILRKLKSDGLVTTYLMEASGGPPRKYYSLTATGRESYSSDRTDYLNFASTVQSILEEQET